MFRFRRVGVSGSSKGLPANAVLCCQAVGDRLARDKGVIVVSGGTRKRHSAAEDDLAAEWHVVQAAMKRIDSTTLRDRVETFLRHEPGRSEPFEAGTPRRPRGRTGEARRFSYVRHLDALIAIAGGSGTKQELALASELNLPILPIPIFGGAARAHWHAYRQDIVRSLAITDGTASGWEKTDPNDARQVRALTIEMVDTFLRRLPWGCFVITPFKHEFKALYGAIERAVRGERDNPIKMDRDGLTGDVREQIRQNLAACDYAIVVLDGLSLNVLYELGLAHGRNKPTILLNRTGALTTVGVPFDIAGDQRIEYEAIGPGLVRRLRSAIVGLHSSGRP